MIFAAASQVFFLYFKVTACVSCHKKNHADAVENVEHPQLALLKSHDSHKMSHLFPDLFSKDHCSDSSSTNLPSNSEVITILI